MQTTIQRHSRITRLCTLLAWVAIAFAKSGWTELQPGRPAPPFREKNVEGRMVSSNQLRVGALLLDFWATWANPCKDAMPQWQKLHQKYGNKDACVIGVAMDEDPKRVKPFLRQRGITYEILLDTEGKIAEAYKVREQPTTYLIDRKGVIRYVYPGYRSGLEKTVEQNILDLLKEK